VTEQRPPSAIDRVLEVLDVGTQSSTETGLTPDGWGAPERDDDACSRCQHAPAAEGRDLCVGCRDFLLEDSDVDPARDRSLREATQAGSFEVHAGIAGPVVLTGMITPDMGERLARHQLAHLSVQVERPPWDPPVLGDINTHVWVDEWVVAVDPAEVAAAVNALAHVMQVAVEAVAEAIGRLIASSRPMIDAIEGLGVSLDTDPIDPVEAARARDRERNREVLAEQRRAHRRTNRLGPPPGRR
jgi:hypothetical protein